MTFHYQHLDFFDICRFCEPEVPQTCIYSKKTNILIRKSPRTCIYSKKNNILMPKVHKTCIYSKKSKVLIVKSHQTCKYSKKSKKSKTNSSMPVSQSHIESEIFDFFDFFEYMQVLCTFGIKMLIFFEYMQVW